MTIPGILAGLGVWLSLSAVAQTNLAALDHRLGALTQRPVSEAANISEKTI